MDDKFSKLGEEINQTVKNVLSSAEFSDLKRTINTTMREVGTRVGDTVSDTAKKAARSMQESIVQSAKKSRHRASQKSTAPPNTETPTHAQAPPHTSNVPASFQPSLSHGRFVGIASLVIGICGALPLSLMVFVMLIAGLISGFSNIPLGLVLFFGIPLIGFWALALNGAHLRGLRRRFLRYQAILVGRSFCEISELAAVAGKSTQFVLKDIKKILRLHLLPEGYVDTQGETLMLDYATYELYLSSVEEMRKKQNAPSEEVVSEPADVSTELAQAMDEGQRYLLTIRQINEGLPAQEISALLDMLEAVIAKIFGYVEQHPEKLPQIRKFMCYYLPMTLKLTQAYRDLEKHSTGGAEAANTRSEIVSALGKIGQAFEALLAQLMHNDLLDISTDISALEAMLAQEGLTQEQDFPQELKF